MAKINLSDRKVVVLFAALLSSTLAFIILRSLLTNPGIIEAIDIQWNQNFAMFEYFFHTWNFYNNGSNIIFASQFPIYGWVLVFRDVALAQRFVYFVTVSLVSFNMFIVAFYTLKRTAQKAAPVYLGSILASLIYTLNPLMLSEIFHISFLWAYSLFPLVFYFGWESFNTSSRRKVLLNALLLSLFFAFMADAWGMIVGLLIIVITAISSVIINGWKNLIHRFIPNILLTLLTMGTVTVSLAAYWLLPYITQRASGPGWDIFSVANLVSNSQYSGLTNIFGLHSWNVQPFFASPIWWLALWSALTLLLPVFAVLAVLVRRSKLTLTLSSLLAVGLFLATGVKYASVSGADWWARFGELYLWLTFYSPRVIPVQSFLLKYPYLFLAMASLAVAVLSAVLVSELFRRVSFNEISMKRFSIKSHGKPIVLFFSIVSLISLVGAPLLTGNLMGALNPVTLPDQYKELNAFFSSQNGSFRVMYVPQEANFIWSDNQWANKIEYWGSGATPLMYGWGIVASPNTGFLGNMIYDYLLTNQTQYLGKLLALGNVRFIVFHNDSKIASQTFDLYFKQYKNYFNSFLSSSNYTYYFIDIPDNSSDTAPYLYSTIKQEYLANYKNSSEYQSISPFTEESNSTIYENYQTDEQFKNSYFYKKFLNSRTYLNDYLNSQEYQGYLKNFSEVKQNFLDSPMYKNSHNYLNSSEFLVLTGSQYFANSPENRKFINSVEYRTFLDYYLIYTSGDFAFSANEQYGASYQTFLGSDEYKNYQAYLSIYPNMFSNLQAQKDLKLVPFSSDNLFVFENMEMTNYFQGYSKVNLVVGGLDTFGSLSKINDFYLNDSAYLFIENQGITESNLDSFLNSEEISKNVVFYNNKTVDDLVFDTFDNRVLVAPSDIFIETSQDGWLNDVATSYSWTPVTLSNYNSVNASGKYDFSLGHNILYTTNNKSLNFPVDIDKQGEYDVWARVLFSPAGGNLTFSIDNNNSTVNTNTTKVIGTETTTSTVTSTTLATVTNSTDADSNGEIIDSVINTNTTQVIGTKTESNFGKATIPTFTNYTKVENTNKTLESSLNKFVYSTIFKSVSNNATYETYTTMATDLFTEITVINNNATTAVTDKITTVYANGNTTITTNTTTTTVLETIVITVDYALNSILSGFKWVHCLGNIVLDPGTFTVNIGNEAGTLNAVNMVAFPTVNDLEEHRQNVFDLLNQSDARIIYVMDKAFLGSLKIGSNLYVLFNAPKQSLYNINIESNHRLSELYVTVDNIELIAASSNDFAEGENWYSTGPIYLGQGSHNITLSNGFSQDIEKIIINSSDQANSSTESLRKILGEGAETFVLSFEKTDPVSFSVVVNSTKPFILAYQEPYDEFWESNTSASRIIINSVNNGYFIDGNRNDANEKTSEISITYTPERYLQLGVKISAIAFILTTLSLILILLYPRFKKKKPLLNKPNG